MGNVGPVTRLSGAGAGYRRAVRIRSSLLALLAPLLVVLPGAPAPAQTTADLDQRVASTDQRGAADTVLAISIDGLSVAAIERLGPVGMPNLHAFMDSGAATLNARTEREQTVTLPNHTGMVTGRRIEAATGGHGVTWNDNRVRPRTVQAAAGERVESVFSTVDAAGGSSALFAAKTKFRLWSRSWPNAIDRTTVMESNAALVEEIIADINDEDRDFRFLHLSLPDVAGHAHGWMSPPYLSAVRRVDALLGLVVGSVTSDAQRRADTTILLTSDHGGQGAGHENPKVLDDYRVPFMARGAGVDAGVDLYEINAGYHDPGTRRTIYGLARPPVRNGMVANLALDLLGLPAVADSEFDVTQDLSLSEPARAH